MVKVAGTILLATFAVFAQGARSAGGTVRWVHDPLDPRATRVEVGGLDPEIIRQVSAFRSAAEWHRVFVVYAGLPPASGDAADAPSATATPMAGSYSIDGATIMFRPAFPVERGVAYDAFFTPAGGASGGAGAERIRSTLSLPAAVATPSTVVEAIHPSAGVVPENLLKFYVHFSSPMSGGDIYRHIHLRDLGAGRDVELPFLQIGEELWNAEMTRLTLIIDPGRIKRGVKPLEDIGPVLETGKRFSLLIDAAWQDATGAPLKASFEKRYEVGPPDRDPPDPAKWTVRQPPAAGTRGALTVAFTDPMDHALATRMIEVIDPAGRRVEGTVALADEDRRWNFTPATTWAAGSYRLSIPTTIEDLAGNNIGKPFDVDLFEGVQRRVETPHVQLPFEIR